MLTPDRDRRALALAQAQEREVLNRLLAEQRRFVPPTVSTRVDTPQDIEARRLIAATSYRAGR